LIPACAVIWCTARFRASAEWDTYFLDLCHLHFPFKKWSRNAFDFQQFAAGIKTVDYSLGSIYEKKLAGAEGFEHEPCMLNDSLKSLISSVPHDLGRLSHWAKGSVPKRFYTAISIKTVVQDPLLFLAVAERPPLTVVFPPLRASDRPRATKSC
jgi:hypothetical protein